MEELAESDDDHPPPARPAAEILAV